MASGRRTSKQHGRSRVQARRLGPDLPEIHKRRVRGRRVQGRDDLLLAPYKGRVVQARSFADLLEQSLRRYQNRAIETAQVIEELISLAKALREASSRGESLGLSDDELAFYDALETNDSAVAVMGDEALLAIALELTEKVRASVTIDWTVRESARAKLKVLVKRILRVHGYPPDKQERATETVLEQAEPLSDIWAVA